MTVAHLVLNGGTFLGASADRGESPAAVQLRKLIDQALDAGSSVSLGGRFWALDDAYEKCAAPDWDGYGALPANPVAYEKAKSFLRLLPADSPAPEIAVDPDGEITFEWQRGPRWVFTVSVGGRDHLSYAGLFGGSRVYGTESFAEGLPRAVAVHLARVIAEDRNAPAHA